MSEVKNIVVIGGGYAGVNLAKTLEKTLSANYRVILIEKRSHFFHNIASLRASVEDIDNRVFIPYTNLFKKTGLFVQATVTSLHKNTVHISPSHADLGSQIEFEYAVIATGSEYPEPAKLHALTKEENVNHLQASRKAVKEAKSVLIIGGGSVGLELAGEIKGAYPSKEVTIVHSGTTLLSNTSFSAKFKAKALSSVEALGIKVVLGEKVIWDDNNIGRDFKPRTIKTEAGKEYLSDLQFVAFGVKPNGGIIESLDSSLLNPETHGIKVKPTFQLDSDAYPHIFAVGDVTDIKGEPKMAMRADKHQAIAAKNIQALISNTALVEHKSDAEAIVITLSKNGGLGFFGGMTLGNWLTKNLKSKSLFIDKYWGVLGATPPKA